MPSLDQHSVNTAGSGTETVEDTQESQIAQYQLEMMRLLRDVNVDHNTVGWYQCVPTDFAGISWLTETLVDTQYRYQKKFGVKCVFVIYDGSKASNQSLGIRAFRLSEKFCQAYKTGKFATSNLQNFQLSDSSVLEEFPVTLRTSPLQKVLLSEIEKHQPEIFPSASNRLESLSVEVPAIQRQLEAINDGLEEWQQDQNSWAYWWRGAQRDIARQTQMLQKKRAENESRKVQGLPSLPEEAFSVDLTRIAPEPSRLGALLLNTALRDVSRNMGKSAGQAIVKAYTAKALQQ